MKKVVSIISLFLLGFGIVFLNFSGKETLHEAKWNAPDTTLAITINGEISTTFPTTNAYTSIVECTNGTGKAEWNGTKWILIASGITKGSTKCNITFTQTFKDIILADNEVKTPLTTPGKEASAHVLDDTVSKSDVVTTTYQAYYITYGTGWTVNGTNFNLTGTAVTSDTYANSYSSLVGKYLPSRVLSIAGSSTAGTKKTTTNLNQVFYIIDATQSKFTYKILSSNRNTTEALLASTEDDYGTSYYFRGAVKNNYVQFANKCWRIVRIIGDGSVKLVLHNDNTSGVINPCASSNNNTSNAYAHLTSSTRSSKFNLSGTDNAYVGFMYGTAGTSDYASTHANVNKSTILTNLETWYENNLASFEGKLADIIWCGDKSTFTTYASGSTYGTGLGYGTNKTGYGAYNRIFAGGSTAYANPTLICPNDNNGGKLSKFTVSDTTNGNGNLTYKIGLLTADEIVFSGAVGASGYNTSTYLQENSSATWWTMSPNSENGSSAVVYGAYDGGLNGSSVTTSSGLRPAIALAPSTAVSGGTGTSEDPYVVE